MRLAIADDLQAGQGRWTLWWSVALGGMPGLVTAAAATLAAGFLADHYGAPLTLMALLVGLAMNFLGADERLAPGLAFASRTLLRIGIVLVGLRITTGQIADLGLVAFAATAVIATLTIAGGVLAARWLGFSNAFGALAGGAVAICGASAALAFATLLGERRAPQAQLTLVLVGISALSALAMFTYPILAGAIGLGDRPAGFMLGAAIHDVAQALGAGYAVSPEAGATAAVVKLTRVALLAPALACVALFLPRHERGQRVGGGLPWFVVAFFVVAGVNSTGVVPEAVSAGGGQVAAALLACAVAATGIRSPMQELLKAGWRPLLVILLATLTALLLSVAAASYLIR
jgi:uncharacterized integral membrane protein (TIGR00698 family)